ncbi:MAG: hypothetical protein A2W80_14285 [Candidatus Riflebacteria bacterium GWC2_50_8]|nr:MAG: hypothetical protein A2W80_14285 [Candidatus Riflebacteria bacterium GWC2_50_8]
MSAEFVVKLVLSFIASIFAIYWGKKQALTSYNNGDSALLRLRAPIFLSAAFFAGSMLLSHTNLMRAALEFDPSLPIWLMILAGKLLFLSYIVKRMFRHPAPELTGLRNLIVGIFFIGTTVVETVVIIPAALFVGPPAYDKHGVTLQTLQVTCVPSTLSTICKLYGEPINEYEATRRVKTLFPGSLTSHSVTGCRALGFTEAAYSKMTIEQLLTENLPFIVTVSTGISNVEHAVGVIGWREGQLYLANPLRGLVITTPDQLKKISIDKIRLGPRNGTARPPFLDQFTVGLLAL